MRNLKTRLDRLEADKTITLIRQCPRCKQMVVWSDVLDGENLPDCERHRPAPPIGPGDIVLKRSYGRPL